MQQKIIIVIITNNNWYNRRIEKNAIQIYNEPKNWSYENIVLEKFSDSLFSDSAIFVFTLIRFRVIISERKSPSLEHWNWLVLSINSDTAEKPFPKRTRENSQ